MCPEGFSDNSEGVMYFHQRHLQQVHAAWNDHRVETGDLCLLDLRKVKSRKDGSGECKER